jgi:hypothetical protein
MTLPDSARSEWKWLLERLVDLIEEHNRLMAQHDLSLAAAARHYRDIEACTEQLATFRDRVFAEASNTIVGS